MKRNLMLLAFALLLNVMFFSTDVNAEGSVTSQADVLSVWGNEAPIQEKQLFSGWYIDQNYDKPITSKSQIPAGGAYAKFVDEKVLSVNLQVKENTNGRFDMRLISSVDTLNYKKIGFDIYYNGKTTPVTYESEFVFERIQASVDGVTYNYSPQVIDVDSEYFVTVTIKNIHPNNLNKIFYIQPYWKTIDGVKVYGVSRYLTVEQGTAVGNINMPVKMDDPATDTIEIKVGSTTVTANVAYYDSVCGYAHLNIPVEDKTALKSATTIMDSANNRLAVYRNLETTYNGTADNTWYTEYRKLSGNTETEYTIATSADLYGLAAVVNGGQAMSGMSVYVISDIQVNSGDSSAWTSTNPAEYTWTPIGQSTVFQGTFDGNGHTISGIYMNSATQYSGLFGQANANATLRDFYLKDSFFYASKGDLGSVIGSLSGSMEKVYSSAVVQTISFRCGGLCGTIGGGIEKSIKNCQFAGSVSYNNNTGTNGLFLGGLVGQINSAGIKKLENCLMSGTCSASSYQSTGAVQGGYYNVGGILGGANNTGTINIQDCMVSGKVSSTNTAGVGTIIGTLTASATVNISDTYMVDIADNLEYTGGASKTFGNTGEGYGYAYNAGSAAITSTFKPIESTSYAGYGGMDLALNFNDTWVLQKETTPVLRKFVKSGLIIPDVTWETDENGAYLISSIEELAGLAYKSQKQNYPGKTFKLTQDIALNQKEMSSWNNDYSFKYEWLPIGNATYAFASTFDGDGHTISGIYMNSNTRYSGLFATTNANAILRDFNVTESYFFTTQGDMGSIVGKMSGSMEGVCSSAIVETISFRCGGLCGTIGGGTTQSLKNSHFSGTVSYNNNAGASQLYLGGVAGQIESTGIKTIENCLMTGSCTVSSYKTTGETMTGNYYVGGILGGVISSGTANVMDCVVRDKITSTNTAAVGAIVGLGGGTSTLNITDCYMVDIADNMTYTGDTAGKTFSNTGANGGYGLKGSSATINSTFKPIAVADYDGYAGVELNLNPDAWVIQKEDMPTLRFLVTEGLATPDVNWETDDSGAYLISSIEELAGLAYKSQTQNYPSKTFKLTQDIALNQGEMDAWMNGDSFRYEWLPIGNATYAFASTFDGKGYTISGIYMNSDTQYSGLFATTNASSMIRDFYLTDSYFYTNKGDMGSIVGKMSGSMDGVYSSAIVETISLRCGGLCGTIGGGTEQSLKNSQFAGSVSYQCSTNQNTLYLGGIVGQIDSTGIKTVAKCLMTGTCVAYSYATDGTTPRGGYYYVGGILGGVLKTGTINIQDCVVRGKVSATNAAGVEAIVGNFAAAATVSITDCYMVDIADNLECIAGKTFANTGAGGGYGFNTGSATITSTFKPIADEDYLGYDGSKLNLDTTGWVLQKDAMPELRNFVTIGLYTPDVDWETDSEGAYLIGSMEELAGLAYKSQTQNYAGKTFKVTADLVLNEGTVDTWNNEDTFKYEWIPIGNGNKAFASTFDGDGHTISGIYMNSDARYSGLFGAGNANATLCNFSLKDSYFYTSKEDMGSVVGSLNGSMENIYSSAIVESSSYRLGGLCGIIAGGTYAQHITNCWFDGSMIADGSQISTDSKEVGFGGIVGTVKNAGAKTIENCLSSASVQVTKGQSSSEFGIGGVVGVVYSNSSNVNLTISNSVSACEFTVDASTGAGSVIGIMYDNAAEAATNTVTLTNAYSTNQSIETVSTGVGLKFAQATLNGRTIEVSADDYLIGYAGYDKSELLDFENTWTLRKDNIPALKQFVPETEQMTAIEEFLAIATLGTGITLRGNGVDAGDGSYVITVDDTTGSIYTDYIAALGNKGFIEYANNNDGLAAAGVQNVIYTKVDGETTWVVTVTHAGNDKQKTYVAIRTNEALSPHLDGAVSYTNENGYTTTGLTPTVTMLQIQKAESSGQSFVIQLSNGHFIVYDGGFEVDLEYLITYMKGLSDGQKPIVEAWVVSHAHQDHAGVFAKVYTDARDGIAKWADEIYVEGIYYNESAAYVKGNFTPVESGESLIYDVMDLTWYEKVQRGMNLLKTTIDDTTPIYRYRTGQRFTFADVTMDVVQMEENLFDVLVSNGMYNDGSNATSTTVLFTINGKKVYLGGDERLSNMNFTQAAYNASHFYGIDVYVAPHHGANTSPSFNAWCTNEISYIGSLRKFGLTLFPCYGETPVYWQGDTTSEKNYQLITEYTMDSTIYTYANGNVVLTIGDTISVSK